MGKVAKASSNTAVKAGKKKSYVAPPAPNPENQRRREAGQQQFQSREQFTQKIVKVVLNKKTFQFEDKIVDDPIPFIWDKDRKQFVYSIRKEARER